MRTFSLLILLFFGLTLKSQDFVDSMLGIRLGQFNDCLNNQYGKPFQKQNTSDGWSYQAFFLTKDSTLYILIESTKEQPNLIQTIQITGKESNYSVFKGLKIGDSKSKVFKILGNPIDSVKVEDVKAMRYGFKNANYSIEIAKNKLYSVKIHDNYNQLKRLNKLNIPGSDDLFKALSLKNRAKLIELFCPDIEVSKADQYYSFKYRWIDEINYDKSGIFNILFDSKVGLSTMRKDNLVDQNLRITENKLLLYVFKFTNHGIKEIVYKNYQGSYKIWEIKYE